MDFEIIYMFVCFGVCVCVFVLYVHDHVAILCVKFLVCHRMLLIILNVKCARPKDNCIAPTECGAQIFTIPSFDVVFPCRGG